ncbi:hypothetical protein [Streptomyces hirsutus]|uniref:hypothetical protein n=1 Tax=Streptomyces hirsutus TaxID=35620 RepID=UPI00365EA19E
MHRLALERTPPRLVVEPAVEPIPRHAVALLADTGPGGHVLSRRWAARQVVAQWFLTSHSADPDDVTLRPDEYPDYGPAEFLDQRGGRAPGTRGSGRPIGMR